MRDPGRERVRTGQVIGATNWLVERPRNHPITFQNVFATLYHTLGIDPVITLPNQFGQPL